MENKSIKQTIKTNNGQAEVVLEKKLTYDRAFYNLLARILIEDRKEQQKLES